MKFSRVQWEPEAAPYLLRAARGDETVTASGFQKRVENGDQVLFRVDGDDKALGYALLGISDTDTGDREGVICGVGLDCDPREIREAMNLIVPASVAMFRDSGCKFVRAHSGSKSVVMHLARNGFMFYEYQFRKAL